MIRISIAAASLALLAATNPGLAEDWDAYRNSMQHQYGTYDNYKSYDSYRPSYGGYSYDNGYRKYGYGRYGYGKRYDDDYGYRKYGYGSRYGYGYRCTYNCY
jgi:hypothetical protein